MKLTEKLIRRQKEIRVKSVGFRIDEIRLPNRKKAVRGYLDHPGAVGVVAFVDRKHILMVKQYRHPVGEITWEIPAGKLDPKESPITCVKRELEEETGFLPGRIKKLLSYWPTAAFSNEIIHLYRADRLKKGKQNPDEDEFLNCRVWSVDEVKKEIRAGRIKDSKTLIAFGALR